MCLYCLFFRQSRSKSGSPPSKKKRRSGSGSSSSSSSRSRSSSSRSRSRSRSRSKSSSSRSRSKSRSRSRSPKRSSQREKRFGIYTMMGWMFSLSVLDKKKIFDLNMWTLCCMALSRSYFFRPFDVSAYYFWPSFVPLLRIDTWPRHEAHVTCHFITFKSMICQNNRHI